MLPKQLCQGTEGRMIIWYVYLPFRAEKGADKIGRKYTLKQRNKAKTIIWHKQTRMLQQQPFYGRHTSQSAYPVKNYIVEAKFYYPHALSDGN